MSNRMRRTPASGNEEGRKEEDARLLDSPHFGAHIFNVVGHRNI